MGFCQCNPGKANYISARLHTVHCNENPIYECLFWELRGLSPKFHIHVSVIDFYIPKISPHISCGNWNCGGSQKNFFLGIFVSNFQYLFFAV